MYHHCRPLGGVVFNNVTGTQEFSDPDLKDAYLWLEKEVGFYPLFLSVGISECDLYMTGYNDNWRVVTGWEHKDGVMKANFRKRGEFPNHILFSFAKVDGVFTDYDAWHIVLNADRKNYKISDYEKRLIFKPSWTKAKWLLKAKRNPHSVQLVAPRLFLPDASRVMVRNRATKDILEKLGFGKVEVNRISLECKHCNL